MIINVSMTKEESGPKTSNEIKQAKIFKKAIMTQHSYPPTFLSPYPVLNPPEKQLHKSKTQHDIGH